MTWDVFEALMSSQFSCIRVLFCGVAISRRFFSLFWDCTWPDTYVGARTSVIVHCSKSLVHLLNAVVGKGNVIKGLTQRLWGEDACAIEPHTYSPWKIRDASKKDPQYRPYNFLEARGLRVVDAAKNQDRFWSYKVQDVEPTKTGDD